MSTPSDAIMKEPTPAESFVLMLNERVGALEELVQASTDAIRDMKVLLQDLSDDVPTYRWFNIRIVYFRQRPYSAPTIARRLARAIAIAAHACFTISAATHKETWRESLTQVDVFICLQRPRSIAAVKRRVRAMDLSDTVGRNLDTISVHHVRDELAAAALPSLDFLQV